MTDSMQPFSHEPTAEIRIQTVEIPIEAQKQPSEPIPQWGHFITHDPLIKKLINHPDGDRAELMEDFSYQRHNGQVWVAKKGLVFDGASIPRPLWVFSTNPWASDVLPAAIIHDQYCSLGRIGESMYDSGEVHRCFYEMLRCIGVSAARAEARWFAVRKFGPRFKAKIQKDVSEVLR